jgi:ribose 5-phosphate isomerase B
MRWYTGSDHAGFRLKRALLEALRAWGDEVTDVGAHSDAESVDYPDYGAEVGRLVVAEPRSLGLLVCGTGIGIAIAANKIVGVRAARVTDGYSARMARQHNDANVICLGERVTGVGAAEEMVRLFRDEAFAGGRHARRVEKIAALERIK